ncbi:MAG: glycosyltransferase [Planctomycetota bacterium]
MPTLQADRVSQAESHHVATGEMPGAGMRVVHLAKYYPPASGGIESHVRTLALSQARLGCQVDVVAVNHRATNGDEVTFDHFRRTRSRVDRDAGVRVHRLGRQFTMARFDGVARLVPRLRRIAGGGSPCVWHLHAPNITMSLAALRLDSLRPLVITHHSDIVRQKRLAKLVMPVLEGVYKKSAAIYATSPPYLEGSQMLQRHRQKCQILPLGVDLAPFVEPNEAAKRFAAKLIADQPGPRWLTVGRMVYYKNFKMAVGALKQAPGSLMCIGEGPQLEGLRAAAVAEGVNDRITWMGRVSEDELVGAYLAATALWLPSSGRAEAFGLVQVEAMASGCPVINTQIAGSGVPWVCPNEEAGLTVPVDDARALADAAQRLVCEAGLRDRLARRGAQLARERFAAEVMAHRCLESYREVLSPARGRGR